MAVPPGVSERDFARALEQFRSAIGREWVFTSDEDLNLYRDAYSPFKGEAEDRVPSAAVVIAARRRQHRSGKQQRQGHTAKRGPAARAGAGLEGSFHCQNLSF